MYDGTSIRRQAAILLPIGCMRVVPPRDDPWVVDRHM
jgi:hypothetical protein